jgi:hypothetical protein
MKGVAGVPAHSPAIERDNMTEQHSLNDETSAEIQVYSESEQGIGVYLRTG